MEAPTAFSNHRFNGFATLSAAANVRLVGDDKPGGVRSLEPRTPVRNVLVKLELLDVRRRWGVPFRTKPVDLLHRDREKLPIALIHAFPFRLCDFESGMRKSTMPTPRLGTASECGGCLRDDRRDAIATRQPARLYPPSRPPIRGSRYRVPSRVVVRSPNSTDIPFNAASAYRQDKNRVFFI